MKRNSKQAGAELCKAQFKLRLAKPDSLIHSQPTWLAFYLTWFAHCAVIPMFLWVGQMDVCFCVMQAKSNYMCVWRFKAHKAEIIL